MEYNWSAIFGDTALWVRVSKMKGRTFYFYADICNFDARGNVEIMGRVDSIVGNAWPSYSCKEENTKIVLGDSCVAVIADKTGEKVMSIAGHGIWSVIDRVETRIFSANVELPSIRLCFISGIYLRRLDFVARIVDDVSGDELAVFYPYPYFRPWTTAPIVKRLLPLKIRKRLFSQPRIFRETTLKKDLAEPKMQALLAVSALRFCVDQSLAAGATVE